MPQPKPRRVATKCNYEKIAERTLQPTPGVMSARALGVLCHLLSRPAGWTTTAEQLARIFTEGREAMERTLRDLELLGFLARRKVRVDDRWQWIWIFGDNRRAVARDFAKLLAEHGIGLDELGEEPLPEAG